MHGQQNIKKHYFMSYTKFSNPETIVLGKKNVLLQAYGQGIINIQMFHNGLRHDATLKNVWYVPDACAQPFSVKAAAQNDCSTTLNEKEIVIRRGDGTVAASGKLVDDLYILAIRIVLYDTLQRSAWQRKRKHFKYGMNDLFIE